MIKKTGLLIFFSLVMYTAAHAEPILGKPHAFGITAGFVDGVGITYRYWPHKWGFQFTVLPYYRFKSKQGLTSLSTTMFRNIKEFKWIKFYLYSSAHYFYLNDVIFSKNTNSIALGVGPGIEVRFNIMSLCIGMGVRGYYDFVPMEFGFSYTADLSFLVRF